MAEMRLDAKQMALLAASALLLGSLAAWGMYRLSHRRLARSFPLVRPAGAEAMDTPPEDWDIVDEQSDASFPASDPPGNY
jgi:hypothetical protein